MKVNRKRTRDTGPSRGEVPAAPADGVGRREFISNGCKLAGALLFASSLGALAGCGRDTTSSVGSGSTASTYSPEKTEGSNTPATPSSPSSSVNVDCRFYDNGICSKTGKPCTNCGEGQ